MSVPASILESLDTRKLPYELAQREYVVEAASSELQTSSNSVVKALLLQDAKGQVQVLIPSEHIVDIQRLQKHFDRPLEPVPPEELRAILETEGLSTVPAVPCWRKLDTIIDAKLLKQHALKLDCGSNQPWIEVSGETLQNSIDASRISDFTSPAPKLSFDPDQDEAQILDSVSRFTQRRIKQRLDETLEMPPLPDTAQKIIQLRADPNADINDLTNIVEVDPSLAAQVVSWAASPYYSAPGKIRSVHDAIVRVLGFDMVLNLALGLSLGKTLNTEVLNAKQIQAYWRNAVYTAAALEGLVTSIERKHRPGFGMAYLAGLLNNFGYLVMAQVFPPYFTKINRLALVNPHIASVAIEQDQLGISSNQMAAWLLDSWSMPDEVVISLRQQWNTQYSGEHAIYPKLIYVAKTMLNNASLGQTANLGLGSKIYEDLHLDPEVACSTIDSIFQSSNELDAIADMMRR